MVNIDDFVRRMTNCFDVPKLLVADAIRIRAELAAKDARIADQAAWAIGSVAANEELRREIRTKDARIAELEKDPAANTSYFDAIDLIRKNEALRKELADMRRSDWKVAHIKELEGQLTERRDRVDDLDKELAEAKHALAFYFGALDDRDKKTLELSTALEAANARIAELETKRTHATAKATEWNDYTNEPMTVPR